MANGMFDVISTIFDIFPLLPYSHFIYTHICITKYVKLIGSPPSFSLKICVYDEPHTATGRETMKDVNPVYKRIKWIVYAFKMGEN